MQDPYKMVKDKIVYWCQVNQPNRGACTFSDYWSSLSAGEYKDLQYGNSSPASIDPNVVESAEFSNDSSVADKQTFSVNKTTTDTFSWSLKEGITTKVSGSADIPFLAKGKVEVAISFESTQTHTSTETRSWTYSAEVNVAAKKRVKTSFVVSEAKYHIPFTARVPVRGKVWVQYADGHWWGGVDIDYLMNTLHWRPDTFDAVIEGTFDGVRGMDYKVKVEEFALPSATAVSGSEGPISTETIDAGVMVDGNLHSNFMSLLSEKGPEQADGKGA